MVSAHGPDYQIIDDGSTNGTFVGGVRLSPKASRALRSGDMVRVGRVWLEVRIDQTAPTPDLALATRDLALALVQNAMRSQGSDTVPKVTVVEGADMGAVLPLAEEGRVYLVGRGDNCDLPLADADASREHVQIVRRGATVLVRDLRSKNGSMIGEQPIPTGRDAPWRQSAMVRVGATVLALDEPVAVALGDLETAADEKMTGGDTPPPPQSAKEKEPEPPPRSQRGAEAPIARVEKSLDHRVDAKPQAAHQDGRRRDHRLGARDHRDLDRCARLGPQVSSETRAHPLGALAAFIAILLACKASTITKDAGADATVDAAEELDTEATGECDQTIYGNDKCLGGGRAAFCKTVYSHGRPHLAHGEWVTFTCPDCAKPGTRLTCSNVVPGEPCNTFVVSEMCTPDKHAMYVCDVDGTWKMQGCSGGCTNDPPFRPTCKD